MRLTIGIEDPTQPEILQLLADAEAYSAALYPAESNHHLPMEALRAPSLRFLVGRNETGRAVTTGALALNGDWAEVKAMWVAPAARGKGVSKTMLAALETMARRQGAAVLRLETGVANHAALGLYAQAGFVQRGPFAEYRADPLSVFMEKPL